MSGNRAEQRAARRLAADLDVPYTMALRLMRETLAQDPALKDDHYALLAACRRRVSRMRP